MIKRYERGSVLRETGDARSAGEKKKSCICVLIKTTKDNRFVLEFSRFYPTDGMSRAPRSAFPFTLQPFPVSSTVPGQPHFPSHAFDLRQSNDFLALKKINKKPTYRAGTTTPQTPFAVHPYRFVSFFRFIHSRKLLFYCTRALRTVIRFSFVPCSCRVITKRNEKHSDLSDKNDCSGESVLRTTENYTSAV